MDNSSITLWTQVGPLVGTIVGAAIGFLGSWFVFRISKNADHATKMKNLYAEWMPFILGINELALIDDKTSKDYREMRQLVRKSAIFDAQFRFFEKNNNLLLEVIKIRDKASGLNVSKTNPAKEVSNISEDLDKLMLQVARKYQTAFY
ncbi:MAG: hypothetical protein QNJ97_26425 [Myxococcota bacterium]|nr:hypothetical protein [Myxococcota bacterium]